MTASGFMLRQELNTRLRRQAARLGVSLESLCHLGWALVLSRSSHCEQVVFGTGLRAHRGILPIRVDISETGTEEAARQVFARLEALQAHQQTPLSLALRCSGVGGEAPLFIYPKTSCSRSLRAFSHVYYTSYIIQLVH